MTARELMVVALIPLCQQEIPDLAPGFESAASGSVMVGLKSPCFDIELHRQLGTSEKLFCRPIGFVGRVPVLDALLRRPPHGAGLAEHVAEDVGIAQGHVAG